MLKWLEAIRRFSNDKIIVLLMTTNWCENCKKQSEILRDLELEREFSDNFVFVEEDADERIDLAIRYTPQIYPCISVINKDTILGGTYGLVEKDKLKEILL
ncbi:MAG: thioredoxin family protein, partial [Candidatus Methanomethylicia archaeon]